ncbi:hypothetical protein MASR2M41_18550 [Flammeovirgaceae bacterium]
MPPCSFFEECPTSEKKNASQEYEARSLGEDGTSQCKDKESNRAESHSATENVQAGVEKKGEAGDEDGIIIDVGGID